MNLALSARYLARQWMRGQHLQDLPAGSAPATRAEGYAVQRGWSALIGQVAGWKIAATSVAGQQHIGVSGPLAGPVFASRLRRGDARISLSGNRMRVAECEVVFIFGQDVHPRVKPWALGEVASLIAAISPGIEVPDSRFMRFEEAGEAQLIADGACCRDMVLGVPIKPDALLPSLAGLRVRAQLSDGRALEGLGSAVLGDPLEALRWFVTEMSETGQRIEAGQFVTTGACVKPIPVQPGQTVNADFGELGRMRVRFV